MTSAEEIRHYLEAGRIASKVRERVRDKLHEGMPLIEVCDFVESEIARLGGKPAFPCNVCINEVAAHYTSPFDDTSAIPRGALVKVDIGVQVDGYIADTAVSVSFHPALEKMVEAVECSLGNALDRVRPGVKVRKLGEVIEKTLTRAGMKPVQNLQGHKIARYLIHAGKSIPNVASLDGTKIELGEVYAIEPFATTPKAGGLVTEGKLVQIFRYVKSEALLSASARQLLSRIKTEYRTLPFAKRWIFDPKNPLEFEQAFEELLNAGCLTGYPILVEKKGGIVSQAEHTVIVTKEGCLVTTA